MKPDDKIGCFDMLEAGDAVVAGVSGGADSMALLHLLCSLRPSLHLEIYAAHINHGLRGAEAQRDENFVRKCCTEWQVEVFVLKANVAEEAEKTGETVEEAGRRVRYAFFEQTASTFGAKIATAHTLSDSIETLLLNLTRGTGLKGLCGIPKQRGKIIRPLIETTRREIEEYCKKNAIVYMNDSTNFSRDYTRNKIRLDVVPALYEINPAFDRAVLRALRSLVRDEAMLRGLSREFLLKAKTGEREYDVQALRSCPADLLHRVLAMAAKDCTGTAQEALHIDLLCELLQKEKGAVQLKGGYLARVKGGSFFFGCVQQGTQNAAYCAPLAPGKFENGDFGMEISLISCPQYKKLKNINKQYFNNALDCDRIIGTAVIRSKKQGEGFCPAGRKIHKSFKKLFNEARVPVEIRELIPVISDEKGIVWVYGFGPDERCKVTDETQRVILIKTTDMGG
jgi:tRNA(Ile)-lysidine synthase